jgi:uncharacterized membrane protein
MKATWYLFHMIGQVAWLGGALAAMVVAMAARREDPARLGMVARLQNSIYRSLVAPGALATVLSGILLTLVMYNSVTAVGFGHWMMAMQGVGILAGLVALVHTVPTSNKLARLEPAGSTAAAFQGIRKRLELSALISGGLGMFALLTGALYQNR